jgi:NADH dehydrogenase FAD-containing subunit
MTRLILVGAGHAHLNVLTRLSELIAAGVDVTVIDPSRTLWYSGMVPAVLGHQVARHGAGIPTADIVTRSGATFIENRVVAVEADGDRHADAALPRAAYGIRTETGRAVAGDVVSFALGSTVVPPFPVDSASQPQVIPVKPMNRLLHFATELERIREGAVPTVVIIGGGPSAVEVAGNLARSARIAVLARGDRLVPTMPVTAAGHALDSLTARGVAVRCNHEVVGIRNGVAECSNGASVPADFFVLATGLRAPDVFQGSALPVATDGALAVAATLRVPGSRIFAGGDCAAVADLRLARNGVHAVRQAPILTRNIMRALGLDSTQEEHYQPTDNQLLILNPGDGRGIMVYGDRVSRSRLWLALKQRIDWSFVQSKGRTIVPRLRRPPRPASPRRSA